MTVYPFEYLDPDEDYSHIQKDFEEEWKYKKAFTHPFSEKVQKLYDLCEVKNGKDFSERTGLDGYQRRRLVQSDNTPSMATLVSLMYGLQQNIDQLELMCSSLNVKLNNMNRTHAAYMFVLSHYPHLEISEVNKLLLMLNIPPDELLGGPEIRALSCEEFVEEYPEFINK